MVETSESKKFFSFLSEKQSFYYIFPNTNCLYGSSRRYAGDRLYNLPEVMFDELVTGAVSDLCLVM